MVRSCRVGGLLVHRRRDAVGAEDDDRALGHLVGLLDEDRAAPLERGHHVLVVDDLLADVHRGAVDLQGALDGDHRPVHAGAVAPGIGQQDTSALISHAPMVGGPRRRPPRSARRDQDTPPPHGWIWPTAACRGASCGARCAPWPVRSLKLSALPPVWPPPSLDEARKLPETLPGLPVRVIGLAMQHGDEGAAAVRRAGRPRRRAVHRAPRRGRAGPGHLRRRRRRRPRPAASATPPSTAPDVVPRRGPRPRWVRTTTIEDVRRRGAGHRGDPRGAGHRRGDRGRRPRSRRPLPPSRPTPTSPHPRTPRSSCPSPARPTSTTSRPPWTC